MWPFTGWRRRAKARRLMGLRHKLRRRYGGGQTFTPQEVRETLRRERFGESYLPYAFAMYCTPDDFASVATGDDYRAVRGEIADAFGGGSDSANFAQSDGLSESFAAETDSGGGWFDSGGGDFGDDGGGGDD